MHTMRVQPWAEGQGDFVIINVEDFDPSFHKRLEGDVAPLPGKYDALSRQQLIEAMVERFRADLATRSDAEICGALEGLDRRNAALENDPGAAAPAEPTVDGLTDVEINADLEALKVEFDPRDPTEVRLALRDEARAARDAALNAEAAEVDTVSGVEAQTEGAPGVGEQISGETLDGEALSQVSEEAEPLPLLDAAALMSGEVVTGLPDLELPPAGDEPAVLGVAVGEEPSAAAPGDADGDGLAREDMTSEELRAEITKLNGTFKARDSKPELQANLAALLQAKAAAGEAEA